jgi:hypothetical protein
MTFASTSTLLATLALLLLAAVAALPASARLLPPPPSPPSASASPLPAAAAPGYQGVQVVRDVKAILMDDPDAAAASDMEFPSTYPLQRSRSSSEGQANARPDGWSSNDEDSSHAHMTLNMRLKGLVGRCMLTLSNPR